MIGALLSWLAAEDPRRRWEAALLLVELGKTDEQVIGALVSPAGIPWKLRRVGEGRLLELGKADEQVIGALISALATEGPWRRGEAARLLVQLGKTDEQVIGALISVLAVEDPGLRMQAAAAAGPAGQGG